MSRKDRYGKLVRGWDFRTQPELLQQAETAAQRLGMNKTQFIEYCLKLGIEASKDGRNQ